MYTICANFIKKMMAKSKIMKSYQGIIKKKLQKKLREKLRKILHKKSGKSLFFYILFSVTSISFLVFHEVLIILQQATRKTHPRACQCI